MRGGSAYIFSILCFACLITLCVFVETKKTTILLLLLPPSTTVYYIYISNEWMKRTEQLDWNGKTKSRQLFRFRFFLSAYRYIHMHTQYEKWLKIWDSGDCGKTWGKKIKIGACSFLWFSDLLYLAWYHIFRFGVWSINERKSMVFKRFPKIKTEIAHLHFIFLHAPLVYLWRFSYDLSGISSTLTHTYTIHRRSRLLPHVWSIPSQCLIELIFRRRRRLLNPSQTRCLSRPHANRASHSTVWVHILFFKYMKGG